MPHQQSNSRKVGLTLLIAAAMLVLDASTPLSLAMWLLQVVLLWTVTLWADRRTLVRLAAVCCFFVVIAFLLSAKTVRLPWTDWGNLLLSLGALGALTQVSLRRLVAQEERLRVERELAASRSSVKILTGLLPICAWCKKIRGDAGGWEPLERYIASHSDADFTHGICEGCSAELLAEVESA